MSQRLRVWLDGHRWLIALIPVLLGMAMVWLMQLRPAWYLKLTQENGLVENLQALGLVLGTVLALRVAMVLHQRHHRRWATVYLVVAIGVFVIAGEEISWGQRLLELDAPRWFETHNLQQELNLHNLPLVRLADGSWKNVAWAFKWMLTLGLAGLSIASLIVYRRGARAHAPWTTALWLPAPELIPAWMGIVLYFPIQGLFWVTHPEATKLAREVQRLSEVGELMFVFGVLVFLMTARRTVLEQAGYGYTG